MSYQRKSSIVPFLTFIIIVLVAIDGWYYLTHKSAVSFTTQENTTTVDPRTQIEVTHAAPTDPATIGWKNYESPDGTITLKHPSYISIGLDSKSSKTNIGPTALSYHDVTLMPNPNADFMIFSTYIEFSSEKNFILDLGQRFVSYDSSTNVWYSDSDDQDKPSSASPTYKNIFKPENAYKPSEYIKTLNGLMSYGPFLLGDESRGSLVYLIPVPSKKVIVSIGIKYNNEALANSTAVIKALKIKFDKDLPHIIKSISATNL